MITVNVNFLDAFEETEHPRDSGGRFTVSGNGPHITALQQAVNSLPRHDFGPVEIVHSQVVRNSNGVPVQGLSENYNTHHRIQVGAEVSNKVKVKDPVGTLTHEMGHALYNRKGSNPELAGAVAAELAKLPPADRYLAGHYAKNPQEGFAELYKLAYSPSRKGAFAMGQKSAEGRFKKSLALLHKHLDG